MGKSSIELTLKQLIDLGIINLKKGKKKRKRNKYKVTKNKDGVNAPYRSSSDHIKGFSNITEKSNPIQMIQNTDALRLRDAQTELNTRMMENKNRLEASKTDANDFQEKTKQAFNYVFNSITNPPISGYSEDDNVGVFGATAGSDSFRPMRDIKPDTFLTLPDEIPLPSPRIEEIDESVKDVSEYPTITVERQPTISIERQPQIRETTPKKVSFLGQLGIKSPFSSGKKLIPASMLDNMEEPVREDSFNLSQYATDQEELFGEGEEEQLPEPKIVNRQGIRLPEVYLKTAGGGPFDTPPQQPINEKEIRSDEFKHINKSSTKPTKAEVLRFQDWYRELLGDDYNPEIFTSKKRSVIEPEIVKILLNEYKTLGGADKKMLKTKDSKELAREVERLRRLKTLNKILA